MEILKQELEQIIKEEINAVIEEGWFDRQRARVAGAGAGMKGVGKRIAGAAKYAATGKAPSTARDIQGAYAGGKKTKILELHKKKYDKLFANLNRDFRALNKDFFQDAKALDLLSSPSFSEMRIALKKFRTNSELGTQVLEKIDDLIRGLGAGERTE
tara:strand:- start:304 stop:774 length:471 start_codon:yes stop_codon:yes gene_type:complete